MTGQGADERRIRQLLAARGVSYNPQQPPPPAARQRDWFDDIVEDGRRPAAAPAPRLPDWCTGQTADLRAPDLDRPARPAKPIPAPAAADDGQEDIEDEWADLDEPDQAEPALARSRDKPRRPPGRRAHAAYLDLPGRTRWLLYTGSAAGAGYGVGLVPMMRGWIAACGQDNGTTAAIVLGLGIAAAAGVLIDKRTRGWWGPLPWLCRIPLASALLALALYAPGAST